MTRLGWAMLGGFAVLFAGATALTTCSGDPAGVRLAVPTARPVAEPVALILPSGLALPVANVAPAALIPSFGDVRGGGTRAHGGIDIGAPRGTPVLSATAGTVDKLHESAAGGHTVYVRSSDGAFMHYYAHLDRYAPALAEGQAVRRGQPIGLVGDSGNAGAGNTHLHYAIARLAPGDRWWGGEPIDPYPLLAAPGPAR